MILRINFDLGQNKSVVENFNVDPNFISQSKVVSPWIEKGILASLKQSCKGLDMLVARKIWDTGLRWKESQARLD